MSYFFRPWKKANRSFKNKARCYSLIPWETSTDHELAEKGCFVVTLIFTKVGWTKLVFLLFFDTTVSLKTCTVNRQKEAVPTRKKNVESPWGGCSLKLKRITARKSSPGRQSSFRHPQPLIFVDNAGRLDKKNAFWTRHASHQFIKPTSEPAIHEAKLPQQRIPMGGVRYILPTWMVDFLCRISR